jgi:hypothetical protein
MSETATLAFAIDLAFQHGRDGKPLDEKTVEDIARKARQLGTSPATVPEPMRPVDEEVLRALVGFAGVPINVSALAVSAHMSSIDTIAAVGRLREKGLACIDFPTGYPYATADGYRWLEGDNERIVDFAKGLT